MSPQEPGARRRRFPWWLLLIAIPAAEIYVLIQVGQAIGPVWTVLLLIAGCVLGSALLRRGGRRAWQALQAAIAEGRMPAKELADGILVVIGGVLLIIPGFISDVLGLLAILPFTRPLGRRVLGGFISRRMIVLPGNLGGNGGGNGRRPGPYGDVVQGDVVDPE